MEKLARILYAEDSMDDIELTLAAFKEINMVNQIDIVRDGEEVIDYLFYKGKYANRENCTPTFVLLDIKMPKLDGIEVLKIIRQTDEYKSLPIVMLTSSQMEMDIIRSYQLGANGYVIKPIDFPEFVKAIKGIGYFWAILNTPPSK
ncbi:response regulator [Tenuifilaceae bacterium CYCD]|nr:response regulator [Tenuifilaceae bacterium CYCD]